MSDRDAPVFMAGVAVGALLTVLGYKLFSSCPQTTRTHQVGAKPKCICKKGVKDECQIDSIREAQKQKCA